MYNDFLDFGKKKKKMITMITVSVMFIMGSTEDLKHETQCCAHVCLYSHRVLIVVLKMSMASDQGLLEDSAV